MSTNAVPGAVAAYGDVLAMGAWAEHEDGSLVLVEGVEQGTVIYSLFDVAPDPPVEYRDAMPRKTFEDRYSWYVGDPKPDEVWVWHDKTPFDAAQCARRWAERRESVEELLAS